MLTLYGIPNCNTVKKARVWLDANDIAYTFHDFKKHGTTPALLQRWLEQIAWEKLVNRAGTTWRNLPDDARNAVQDQSSAMALMLEKPSVIKRPVLERDGKVVLLGFSETGYQHATR